MAEDDKKSKIRDLYAIRSDKVKAYIEDALFPDAKSVVIENLHLTPKLEADINKYPSTQLDGLKERSQKVTLIISADEDYLEYNYSDIRQPDFEVLEEIVSYSKSKSIDHLLSHGAVGFENKRVTHLFLYKYRLSPFPESIGELASLEYLDLRENRLTKIPESIGELASLEHLDLGGNRLTKIPESIGNLTNLERLWLQDNQLTEIPESIGNLVNLEWLNSSKNQLTKIPESIGKLVNLERLYLSENRLTKIPESIGKLTNLKELHLYDNPLSKSAKKKLEELKSKRNNLDILYD